MKYTEKTGRTFNADIFIAGDIAIIKEVCRDYVDRGLCVSVCPVDFIFTGGSESGAKIGLINYQRFPTTEDNIKKMAIELSLILINRCHQFSASVVTTKETIFISNERKR